jgi:arginine:ornithine antiporter/lysine permease
VGYGALVAKQEGGRAAAFAFAWIAIVYTLFMFVAAGLKYVLLLAMLFAPGTVLYLWARKEQQARYFTSVEMGILSLIILAALAGAYGLATGLITP